MYFDKKTLLSFEVVLSNLLSCCIFILLHFFRKIKRRRVHDSLHLWRKTKNFFTTRKSQGEITFFSKRQNVQKETAKFSTRNNRWEIKMLSHPRAGRNTQWRSAQNISSSNHTICSTSYLVYFTCKIRRYLVTFVRLEKTVTEMVTGCLCLIQM